MPDHDTAIHCRDGVALCSPEVRHQFCGTPAMARLDDGCVLAAYAGPRNPHGQEPGTCRIYGRELSVDAASWGAEREMIHHPECQAFGPALLTDSQGTLWCFYLAFHTHCWPEGQPDMARTRSDLWVAKSIDRGRAWTDRQMIFRGYSGATNGAVETVAGYLVVPFSYVVPSPGRLVSACVVSTDRGRTWQLGQSIDLGQHGDHSGALEPCLLELRDGRLWMLIRTNLGHFLEAWSEDGGFTFSPPTPTSIKSPSAPCYCIRLQSGRLALAWNNTIGREPGEGTTGAGPTLANRRDILGMALSEDEGRTWAAPIDIANAAQLSYPFILEAAPGDLLVSCQLVPDWKHLQPVVFRLGEELLRGG